MDYYKAFTKQIASISVASFLSHDNSICLGFILASFLAQLEQIIPILWISKYSTFFTMKSSYK
jgi:hypothetical protein